MRMLMTVTIPNDEFNASLRDGSMGRKLRHIVEETKPEATYFSEQDGKRGALLIVNIPDASKIPSLAEPWFLTFNADVKFRIVMSLEDLQKANIEDVTKKWL